jgi:hypothetical protein
MDFSMLRLDSITSKEPAARIILYPRVPELDVSPYILAAGSLDVIESRRSMLKSRSKEYSRLASGGGGEVEPNSTRADHSSTKASKLDSSSEAADTSLTKQAQLSRLSSS